MATILTQDMIDKICGMFRDSVPPSDIAEWLGLRKVTVKTVLKQHFPVDVYGNLEPRYQGSANTIMPNITEPDIFACQLALLVSLGDSFVKDFFDKVRESYPTVTSAIENTPASRDFYTTPELEIEVDMESDWVYGTERWRLENSQQYSKRLY
jgi:hypothetical protein